MRTRSDEAVRREALAASGWNGDEIESWLTAHAKPVTLIEHAALLRERLADIMYALCRACGVIRLSRRLGMTPRQWVLNREERAL
jgi:hypothetical protein